MIKTYGELRKALELINLDKATSTQKKNHAILTDWSSQGQVDDETFSHPQRIDMAIKNLKKGVAKMNEIAKERVYIANAISSMVHAQAVNSDLVTSMRKLAIILADGYQYPQGSEARNSFFERCEMEENPY